MMAQERKYLYLIVTKFPFKGGEPFLIEELKYLCDAFERVYIIIPEGHRIYDRSILVELPENVELFVFNTQPDLFDKLKAFSSLFNRGFFMERQAIVEQYYQRFSLFHIKTWLGFISMAKCFEKQLTSIMKKHNHPASQTCLYSYWFFYATAGLAYIKNRNKSFRAVSRIHGWDCFFERSSGNYLPARPFVFSSFDSIWPISKAGLNYTIKKIGSKVKNKLQLSYLGIRDIHSFPDRISNTNKLNLLSIAFIDPVKRLERIIDALALIDDIQINWSHIGTALNGSEELQNYANRILGNKKNINFKFIGSLTQNEVYKFLAEGQQDILICTSLSEGLPVSMMEAMAHGIPVISVNVGGISEIVHDGSTGYLLPSDADSVSIAAALREYSAQSEEFKTTLRSNARNKYLSHFCASKNYKNFISLALK